MRHRHYPFVIVGAGPAGAACANALRLEGVEGVALVDRASFPRSKARGDTVGPGAVGVMKELGLGQLFDGQTPIESFTIRAPSGDTARLDLALFDHASPFGFMIPSAVFDTHPVKAAFDRGAIDLTGWNFDLATFVGAQWEIRLSRTGTGETFTCTADFLVGADGAQSNVRTLLSAFPNNAKRTAVAARVYATPKTPLPPSLRMDFYDTIAQPPAHGWCSSNGQVTNIGFGVSAFAAQTLTMSLEEMVEAYLSELSAEYDIHHDSFAFGTLPLAYNMPRLAHPDKHAALIGDAGCMANSIYGEGLFYGMYAGVLLGRKLASALKGPNDTPAAAHAYEQEFRQGFRSQYRGSSVLDRMFQHPTLVNKAVKEWRKQPELFKLYFEFLVGRSPGKQRPSLFDLALKSLTT